MYDFRSIISPVQKADEAVTFGFLVPFLADNSCFGETGVLAEGPCKVVVGDLVPQISHEKPVVI